MRKCNQILRGNQTDRMLAFMTQNYLARVKAKQR